LIQLSFFFVHLVIPPLYCGTSAILQPAHLIAFERITKNVRSS
jgi:hypothetical protein